MLHHLKRRGLAEVRRGLRPGGRLGAVDFGATPGVGHLLCVLGLRKGWDHAARLRAMLGDPDLDDGPTGVRSVAHVRGRKPRAA